LTVRLSTGVALAVLSLSGALSDTARLKAQSPTAAAGVDSIIVRWTRISYLTANSVYIDAGALGGLSEGSTATVVRGGRSIADLTVVFVSSNRASCTITRKLDELLIGDSVRFVVRPVQTAVPSSQTSRVAEPAARVSRTTIRESGSLRGRIGLRYFMTSVSVADASIAQPAMDARITGQRLGGSPLGLTLDVRAHQTRSSRAGVAEVSTRTRVYQAAVHVDNEASPARFTLGRQLSLALPVLGLFDGVAADFNWRRAGAGLLIGSQPDVASFGLSGRIREYAGYAKLNSAAGARGMWAITAGAVASYARHEVNREFLYLQSVFVNQRLSLFGAQELDFNRGWKIHAESSFVQPTSTLLSGRLALTNFLSLNGGYDSRRSVRLYRDFLNPEHEFDDSFRRGKWAGIFMTMGRHLSGSVDARESSGGSAGLTRSNTSTASLARLTPWGLGVRARATRYSGIMVEGGLESLALELNPPGNLRLEASAGRRNDRRTLDGSLDKRLSWVGFDLDAGLGRSLLLSLSTYRESGREGHVSQSFAALSYRF
jgi:hypothetical protein